MSRTLSNLQALRGIACLLVVWLHVAVWEREYGVRTPLLREVKWFGSAGVDLFFVLSGFIITYTQAAHFSDPFLRKEHSLAPRSKGHLGLQSALGSNVVWIGIWR